MCHCACVRKKYEIFFASLKKSLKKGVGSGSVSQRYGSADPDPHQNVTRIANTGRSQEVENVGRKHIGWLTSCLRRVTVISTTSPSLLPGHLHTEQDNVHRPTHF